MSTYAIELATDAILALINSRPSSLTMAEIAAIIASKVSSPPMSADVAAHWGEWDTLLRNVGAKITDCSLTAPGTFAAVASAQALLEELEDNIMAKPRADIAHIGLLAQIVYRRAYDTETGRMHERDSDEVLAHGLIVSHDVVDPPLAALLRAIRDQAASARA